MSGKLAGRIVLAIILIASIGWLTKGFLSRRHLRKAEQIYTWAEEWYEKGKFKEALTFYQQLISRYPNNEKIPDSLYKAGFCLYKMGNFEEADRYWERLLKEGTGDAYRDSIYFLRGEKFERDEKYPQALSLYQKLVEEFPQGELAGRSLFRIGAIYEREGKLEEARRKYRYFLDNFPQSPLIPEVKERLGKLNMKLIFSPIPMEESIEYTVKPGDSLLSIATQYNTTVSLIKKSNGLTSEVIHPGKILKILPGHFSIKIIRSRNILTLYYKGDFVKEYLVATGDYKATPLGEFTIVNKLRNPTWYRAGAIVPPDSPENILGTRWLGLSKKGYGIHGTDDPSSMGKYVTQGCIRMLNEDVEELYMLATVGTKVVIVE